LQTELTGLANFATSKLASSCAQWPVELRQAISRKRPNAACSQTFKNFWRKEPNLEDNIKTDLKETEP
jgi:hypothetical protein